MDSSISLRDAQTSGCEMEPTHHFSPLSTDLDSQPRTTPLRPCSQRGLLLCPDHTLTQEVPEHQEEKTGDVENRALIPKGSHTVSPHLQTPL